MRRISLLAFLLTCMLPLSAQVIKVDVGTTFSSMQDDTPLHQFTHTLVNNTTLVGVDWLEHDWFYLSSEVGYMATGGTDEIETSSEAGITDGTIDWKMRRDNIHLNTTFRAKWAIGQFHAFIGAGPKLDIPVNTSIEGIENGNENLTFFKNEVMLGIKTEVGVAYDLNNVRFGINFAYLPDLTRQTSYLNQTTRNNIFSLGVFVGYIL